MKKLGKSISLPALVTPELLHSADRYGDGPGQLRKPLDVCFTKHDEGVAVADVYNYRVQLLTLDGTHVTSFSGDDFEPRHVACTCHGEVAATDAKQKCVRLYDPRSGSQRRFGMGDLEGPFGVATDRAGTIYVTDPRARAVRVFTGDGQLVATHAPSEALYNPLGIAVDSNGRILVCDADVGSVKVLTAGGRLEADAISTGLTVPAGVCVDDGDNIIVANSGEHKVSLYSPDGHLVKDLVTSPEHFLYDPKGVDISEGGVLAVVSWDESKCLLYRVYSV